MRTLLAFVCLLGLCLAAPSSNDLLKKLEDLLKKENKATKEDKVAMHTRNIYKVSQDAGGIRAVIQFNTAFEQDSVRMTVFYTKDDTGYYVLADEKTWDEINKEVCTGMIDSTGNRYDQPGCFTVANPDAGVKYTFYTDSYVNGDRSDPVHGNSESIVASGKQQNKKKEGDTEKLLDSLLKILKQ